MAGEVLSRKNCGRRHETLLAQWKAPSHTKRYNPCPFCNSWSHQHPDGKRLGHKKQTALAMIETFTFADSRDLYLAFKMKGEWKF